MNLIPGNHCMNTIPGDTEQLPYYGQWQGLVLQDGEFVLWSSEDLRSCFYVYELPPAWMAYMAFSRPFPARALGREGGGIWLASQVAPPWAGCRHAA